MTKIDANEALLAYLGGGPDSVGYQPIGCEERLDAYCSATGIDAWATVRAYLDHVMNFPFPADSSDLAKIGDKVAGWLDGEMPEISKNIRRKLANYYTYQWR